ncbi:MAG: 4'-phosphopantetheinyl transferase superfamily protein [Deltaproteobacteria bacterium]|nr:4'-phosphopantetheinyl transferase superfamily protein [Deltaproteobacteria bacterium]
MSPGWPVWIDLPDPFGWCAAIRVDPAAPAADELPALEAGVALGLLHPDERAAASGLGRERRRDWSAGRLALRAALGRVDASLADHGPISADDRGAPRLPVGFAGSISHKRGLAVAIAAVTEGWMLGVDVELDAPPRVDVSRRVLTDAERAVIAPLDDLARGRAQMLRFAIKEAIYKAVDPRVRRYVGFQEVELDGIEDGGAVGAARVTSGLGMEIEAAWVRWAGMFIAAARAR